jgi:hypothetical protein
VSLMSREAVDELDLRVGATAVAVIKSTTVVVERAALRAPHGGRAKADDAADSAHNADSAHTAASADRADSADGAVVVEPENVIVQTSRGRS